MAKDSVKYSTNIYCQAARLYAANLEQVFLSSLDIGFLTALYRVIDRCLKSVLIVKSERGKVVCFLTGLVGPTTLIYNRLTRRLFIWSIPLFPILCSPSRTRRNAEIFRYTKKGIPKPDLPWQWHS